MTQTNPKSHRRGGAAAENVQGDEQEWDRKQHFPPIQPLKVKCKVRHVRQSINTAIREKKIDNTEAQFCLLHHSNSPRHFSLIFPRTHPFSMTNRIHMKRLLGSVRRKDSLTEALRDLQKKFMVLHTQGHEARTSAMS